MIARYTRPEMAAIWTDDAKLQRWLDVELAVCRAWARRGVIPAEDLHEIETKAAFSVERTLEIEKTTNHDVVAFLTIAPIRPGHTLVVPVEQVDQWTDVPPALWSRVAEVSQLVGSAVMEAFRPTRVGSIIAGMEVPHCHVHLIPIDDERQLDFSLADPSTGADELDAVAIRIRSALRDQGAGASVPTD